MQLARRRCRASCIALEAAGAFYLNVALGEAVARRHAVVSRSDGEVDPRVLLPVDFVADVDFSSFGVQRDKVVVGALQGVSDGSVFVGVVGGHVHDHDADFAVLGDRALEVGHAELRVVVVFVVDQNRQIR